MNSLQSFSAGHRSKFHRGLYALILVAGLASMSGCQIASQLATSIIPDSWLTPDEVSNQSKVPVLWETGVYSSALKNVPGHSGPVVAMRLLGQPTSTMVSIDGAGSVLAWDLDNGQSKLVKHLTVGEKVGVAAFGERHALVAYTTGGTVHVACVTGCSAQWSLDRIKATVRSIGFQGDDQTLLIGAADGRVYRWKFIAESTAENSKEREKCFERYAAHQTVVNAVAAHPFGRAFFSADWGGSLFGWLTYDSDDYGGEYDKNLFLGRLFGAPGTFSKALRTADRGIAALSVSSNGERLVIATEDGFIEVWQVKGLELFARLRVHQGRILAVDGSPNATRVASVGKDGFVKIHEMIEDPMYQIAPDALRYKFTLTSSFSVPKARLVKFSSDGSVIVGTSDGTVLELNADQNAAPPTPIPTPTVGIDVETDTDY